MSSCDPTPQEPSDARNLVRALFGISNEMYVWRLHAIYLNIPPVGIRRGRPKRKGWTGKRSKWGSITKSSLRAAKIGDDAFDEARIYIYIYNSSAHFFHRVVNTMTCAAMPWHCECLTMHLIKQLVGWFRLMGANRDALLAEQCYFCGTYL